MRNNFHSPWNLGGSKTCSQFVLRQLKSKVLQDINRRQRKTTVARLMLALQRDRNMLKTTVLGVHANTSVRSKIWSDTEATGELNVLVDNSKFRANRLRHFTHDRVNLRILLEEQRRHALLEDARLLARNECLGTTQQLGVIQVD